MADDMKGYSDWPPPFYEGELMQGRLTDKMQGKTDWPKEFYTGELKGGK